MAINKNKINDNALKFLQKGQIKKAIREYEKILAEEPGDVRTLLKKGDLLVRVGDRDRAVETYLIVANAYSQQGFYLKAVAVFKQILKLDDSRIDVNLRLAEEYQNLGIIGDAMNHLQIVAAYYDQQKMTRESLDILRRIVDLDPENIASRIKLAELYSREDMLTEAVEEFRKAAEDLKNANRVEDYIKVAERLIYHDPSDVQLIKELANIYLQRGDTKRALGKLQICFKADPRDIETLSLLSMAFQELGQLSKTVSVLKEMAKIYEEQGSLSEMQDVYRRVLEIAPDDEEAKAALGSAGASPMDDLSTDFDDQVIEMAPEPEPEETMLETELMPEVADQMTVEAPMPEQDVIDEVFSQPEVEEATQAYESPSSGELTEEVLDNISRLLTETEVYIKYGLNTKAYEHLNKVFEIDPNNLEAHMKLKDLYLSAGQQNHACQELATLTHISARMGRQDLAQGFLNELLELDPEYPDAVMLQQMASSGAAFEDEEMGDSLDFDVDMESSVDVPIDMDPVSFDQLTAPAYDPAAEEVVPEQDRIDSDAPFDSPDDDFSVEMIPEDAQAELGADFLDDSVVAIDAGEDEAEYEEAETFVAQGNEDSLDFPPNLDQEVSDFDFGDDSSMDDYGLDEETIDVGRMVTGQYALDAQPPEISTTAPAEPQQEPQPDFISIQEVPAIQEKVPDDVVDADDLIIMDAEPSDVSANPMLESSAKEAKSENGSDVIFLDDGSGEFDVPEEFVSEEQVVSIDNQSLEAHAPVVESPSVMSTQGDEVPPLLEDFDSPVQAQESVQEDGFGDEEQATKLDLSYAEEVAGVDSAEQVVAESSSQEQPSDDTDFEDGIEEVEFFIQQNLLDEASDALEALEENYSDRQEVKDLAERLKKLSKGEESQAMVTPEDLGEEFDLAAEIENEVDDSLTGSSVDDEFQYSLDDVFSEFKKGVERVVEKEDSATHFDLGIAYREMGLMDDAIGEFQIASQDETRRCESLTMVGMCYLDKERYSEAINTFKDALHSPKITDQQATGVYYEMGNAYELLKDKNEALFYFKKVYKRDPKFRDITARLKKIIKAAGGKSGKKGSEGDRAAKKTGDKNKISYM